MSHYQLAVEQFDEANAQDPVREVVGGRTEPRGVLYAKRMTARLEQYDPEASEALRLAARCQHLHRWMTPRSTFPPGRAGYRAWRTSLAATQAEIAGAILVDAGYDGETITRVQSLVRKEHLGTDAETQVLEDVACLVFLEHYAEAFASQHEEAKAVSVLRKTWRKMSERGRTAALVLPLQPGVRRLVERAAQ